jgi:membrane protease YdiL (CAAX protease family)
LIIIKAISVGIGVLLAGNVPWAVVFARLNLRVASAVPWALAPMGSYLWVYWKYVTGRLDGGRAAWRREHARANPVAPTVWPIALLTGVVGFGALIASVTVMGRLVILPSSAPISQPAGMPPTTVFILLVMGSIVAGVTEEVAFRGYMQTPLERRFWARSGHSDRRCPFRPSAFPEPSALRSGHAAVLHRRDRCVRRHHLGSQLDPTRPRAAQGGRRVVVDAAVADRCA